MSERTQTEQTRALVAAFFQEMAATSGDPVAYLADTVHWDIPGATGIVPWIGRRSGKAEAAEFFARFGDYLEPDRFEVHRIVADGPHAVAIGELRSRVRATGRVIESPFAFDLTVHDGLITRYVMFEDSWRVAEATRP
ncbi:nuclear transport factor 2 family protein [Amycolatopsis aidingensis]|uniref:nuclear transport factor 2 family protein n=1 Tax=Amycolatopsis aidingensis TaxID=2842453 RepID=UPI001C0C0B7F|nr:nuclear transport factor 2 family protein [Amycolatopsis aidingensis]